MGNGFDPPESRTAAEGELQECLERFTAGGELQRCEMAGPPPNGVYVRMFRIVRMPDDRYRGAVIYHIARWENPSLSMIETTRELCRSWLVYAGIPVVRFSAAFAPVDPATILEPTPEQ